MTVPARSSGSSTVEIQALAVAGEILDHLADAGGRRSAAEIARALGMTPPRVWRHLNSLQALGFVDGGADRGFVLGGRLARLGQHAAEGLDLTDVAHSRMVDLRDELDESVYFAVPGEGGGTVVISLGADGPISLRLSLGVVFPWHASASGRVLSAFSPQRLLGRMLPARLEDVGPDPITDLATLRARLDTIRTRFYDVSERAEVPRMTGRMLLSGIAAPVFDHRSGVVGAVGVLTGAADEQALSAPPIRDPLFRCVAGISSALGSTRWEESGILPDHGPGP
ncbi:IclR family transcriptional regulator [Rhodococcus sp. NPDC003318]|uniref:IclR family transcriptional regulator n=1 Tax=Rhodococcus sp. NPDC003318 TaxID=3364503 RepID=UPI00367844FF